MNEGKKILKLITSRQSDRRYSDKPVEKEKLDRITEAGRMAPSACNAQPWKFIVVTDPAVLKRIADAASENICLQARAEGIGSCIIGWFDENLVREILSVPREKRVVLLITLGYSLSEYRTKKRKSPGEVISYNTY